MQSMLSVYFILLLVMFVYEVLILRNTSMNNCIHKINMLKNVTNLHFIICFSL